MRPGTIYRLTLCLLFLSLIILSLPFSPSQAADTQVSIGILPTNLPNADLPPGSSFIVNLNVTGVTSLCGWQLDLSYNQTLIQVAGVEGGNGITSGLVGGTTMPVDTWAFQPPSSPGGTIRLLGHMAGISGASGSGYLAQIRFNAVGPATNSTPLHLSNLGFFDGLTNPIAGVTGSDGMVTVSNLRIVNSSPLPDAEVGALYSVTLTAADGNPPYFWSIQSGTLPAGLSLNSASGVISGTPLLTGGPTSIVCKVTDASLHTTAKELSIKVLAAPVITTSTLTPGEIGRSYLQTMAVSGGSAPFTWMILSGTLPSGLAFSSTGIFSGVPTVVGNYPLTIIAIDSYNPTQVNSKSFVLKILPRGDANEDFTVNMADVIKVERIILSMDAMTSCADVTRDASVNMADVTMIERIILGLN